jgi:hypothetical protein
MSILNLDNLPSAPRGRKINGKFVILGLVALAGIGTTLAGSITLNSSQQIEFGQAVARTASCDTNGGITVAPSAKFANDTGGNGTGTFNLGTISITGIDDNCVGRVFTIKGYDDSSQTPINLVTASGGTPSSSIVFKIAASQSGATAGVNYSFTAGNGTDNRNRIDVGPASNATTASATNIMKLTIESSAN